jgi:hypothetical protein
VAERCYTCGDVGRPASELAEQFPSLGPCLATMKERWWYRAEGEVRAAHRRAGGKGGEGV